MLREAPQAVDEPVVVAAAAVDDLPLVDAGFGVVRAADASVQLLACPEPLQNQPDKPWVEARDEGHIGTLLNIDCPI